MYVVCITYICCNALNSLNSSKYITTSYTVHSDLFHLLPDNDIYRFVNPIFIRPNKIITFFPKKNKQNLIRKKRQFQAYKWNIRDFFQQKKVNKNIAYGFSLLKGFIKYSSGSFWLFFDDLGM